MIGRGGVLSAPGLPVRDAAGPWSGPAGVPGPAGRARGAPGYGDPRPTGPESSLNVTPLQVLAKGLAELDPADFLSVNRMCPRG
ncbi:hypothetical protein GCM10010273_04480 [Streptomyces lavendulocolor]